MGDMQYLRKLSFAWCFGFSSFNNTCVFTCGGSGYRLRLGGCLVTNEVRG